MATVKFYLNHPYLKGTKTFRKDEVAIDLMFYVDKKNRFPLSTGERIPPKYWDKKAHEAKANYTGHVELNLRLSKLKQAAIQAWRDSKGDVNSLKESIRKIIKGEQSEEKKTVISAVRLLIAQYSQEKEGTTVKMYRSILKKIEAFNPNLTFEQLDFNFHDNFKTFLYNSPNPVYTGYNLSFDSNTGVHTLLAADKPVHTVGLFDDTVFKYLVHIKTICAWAVQRGYNVHPSYKEWKIIKRTYPIISLTLDELERIEALNNLPRHLEVARDYLSIACRTGQRISDVKRISSLSIGSGTWTVFQKKGSRMKQKEIHLPLVGFCSPVIDIINKYGGKLPEMAEQNLNVHIKTVCKEAKINQEVYTERWAGNKKIRIPGMKYEYISSHVGKKSFITILAGQGVPIKVISDLTGTSIKTIEKHYLGRTDLYIIDNYLKNISSERKLKKAN